MPKLRPIRALTSLSILLVVSAFGNTFSLAQTAIWLQLGGGQIWNGAALLMEGAAVQQAPRAEHPRPSLGICGTCG
eukprot:12444205-Alexandrium_andersonii.AAC.1